MKSGDKVFYALFLSSFFLETSVVCFQTYFPILLKEMEWDYSMIGILATVTSIGGAIFQLFVGMVSDKQEKLNKKKLLILSTLLMSFALLAIVFSVNLGLLLLVSFTVGICSPVFITTSNMIVTDITAKEEIGRKINFLRASVSIGWAVGGPLFGAIASYFGTRNIFSIASFFGLLALLTIVFPPLERLGEMKQSVYSADFTKVQRKKSEIKRSGFIIFFLSLILIAITTRSNLAYNSIFFTENGLSKTTAGMIIGLGALIEAPVFILAGKLCDTMNERKLMIVGSLAFASVYIMYSQAYSFPEFFVIQIIKGMAFGFFHASCLSFVGKSASSRKGKVFGFYYLSLIIGGILGPSISGFISDLFGLRNMYLFLSFLSGCATCFLFFNMLLSENQEP